jgi:hypothetical protein
VPTTQASCPVPHTSIAHNVWQQCGAGGGARLRAIVSTSFPLACERRTAVSSVLSRHCNSTHPPISPRSQRIVSVLRQCDPTSSSSSPILIRLTTDTPTSCQPLLYSQACQTKIRGMADSIGKQDVFTSGSAAALRTAVASTAGA